TMKQPSERRSRQGLKRRDFIKAGFCAGAVMNVLEAGDAAAQRQTRPAARPISIDLHTHWTPEAYLKAVAELGRPVVNPNPLGFDLDMRRKWMDEHGVQIHVLTLSGGAPWQWASPSAAIRLAQTVNDAAVEAHTRFPDRFIAGISI